MARYMRLFGARHGHSCLSSRAWILAVLFLVEHTLASRTWGTGCEVRRFHGDDDESPDLSFTNLSDRVQILTSDPRDRAVSIAMNVNKRAPRYVCESRPSFEMSGAMAGNGEEKQCNPISETEIPVDFWTAGVISSKDLGFNSRSSSGSEPGLRCHFRWHSHANWTFWGSSS
jgi:hypothetical protein